MGCKARTDFSLLQYYIYIKKIYTEISKTDLKDTIISFNVLIFIVVDRLNYSPSNSREILLKCFFNEAVLIKIHFNQILIVIVAILYLVNFCFGIVEFPLTSHTNYFVSLTFWFLSGIFKCCVQCIISLENNLRCLKLIFCKEYS